MSPSPVTVVPPAVKTPRRRSQRPRTTVATLPEHRWLVWEILFKLGLNGVLVLGSLLSLARLVPHQQVQQAKLQDVQMQVRETEVRVQDLRNEFSRSFDPTQSRRLMEEISPRQDPQQRHVILTEPSPPQHKP